MYAFLDTSDAIITIKAFERSSAVVKIMSDVNIMPVDKMTDLLSKAYISLIRSGIPFKKFPSVMLWGAPGVGKSQGVRQIARRIEDSTKKKVKITDVRLLLFNPVDLRGIPTANADKTLAVWLKPKIFQMDTDPDTVNILFLDEISAAPQSVQAAAYQITLDRTVGEHRLPDNCIVIAAGNRVTDRSVVYHMPKALANRLCHLEIESNVESWASWALNAGIHSAVRGFIDYEPSMLMGFDDINESCLAFPTPRSWEMVSNILCTAGGNPADLFPLIVGCIGSEAAHSFISWCEIYTRTPSVEEIFKGTEGIEVPNRPDVLYALASEITEYVKEHHSSKEIKCAVKYVSRLSPEFKTKIFTEFLNIKSIRPCLSDSLLYDEWFQRSGRSWEDYGL